MASTIDRKKLGKAFDFLTSEKGQESLSILHKGYEAFRGSLPVDLNDAEFKYVSSALATQRSNDFDTVEVELAGGRTTNSAFNLRHGFVVKAKI